MVLKVLAFMALLGISSAKTGQSRWSRQISSYTSDISDWVPLSGPVERELPQIRRQAIAEPRILSEPFPGFVKPTGFSQDTFPSRAFYNSPSNRQLYLQSVPSAPQNYISDQGFNQGLRFGLTQPNYPLSQGFIAPQFNFDNVPQIKPRPQTLSNPIKFENSPPKSNPPIASPIKPFLNQAVKTKPETKFVDGYRAENGSDFTFTKKPQSLQKIKFEHVDKSKEVFATPKTKVEREEVQLLYVPLESLNRGQFNFRSPLTSPQLLNTELFSQRSNPLMQNPAPELQAPIIQPMDTFNSQEFLTNFNSRLRELDHSPPKFTTITTPLPTTTPTTTSKPKKLKPHQPPLAIFLTHDAKKDDQVKVGDVLHSLKNANTVAVLDSVNALNAPKVFIGPSTLSPPENYVKFELPYLSNIENIDKKLRQLPFFVAPLSYNTPQGFAKIPFPAPHVGSVVINSLIKDTPSANKPTVTDFYSNTYSRPTLQKQEQKPITQKPIISYYTTSSPNTNYDQNHYSIEPQAVNTLRPLKESKPTLAVTQSTPYKSGSYFLSNLGNQYNPSQYVNFPQEANNKTPEPTKIQNVFKSETPTTPKTTVTTSTKLPSTYPSQLLETHNPYSINQAFHFSTPLDYQNFFDEYKEAYGNSGLNISPSPPTVFNNSKPVPITEVETEQPEVSHRPQYSSPNYLQNYTPEIHHESEIQNSRYPGSNTNDFIANTAPITQTENTNSDYPVYSDDKTKLITNTNPSQDYTGNIQTQSAPSEDSTVENNLPETSSNENKDTKPSFDYNQYEATYNSQEVLSSTSRATTSTRRSPITSRGRPRYPTVKPESHEYYTRATITRRPLRERKPLPIRSRYEPNKITTEAPTRKPINTTETTSKSTRTRTRGRIHYKPSDTDDYYNKRNKPSSKDNDLAYQRDVLHQNYPVTLMERTSTVDIEAITEPSEKAISTNNIEIAKSDDTEDAYSNDKLSITKPVDSDLQDLPQQYTTAIHSVTDAPYVPKVPNHHDGDYSYQSKGSAVPDNILPSYDEIKEENYAIQTSEKNSENQLSAIKTPRTETETNIPVYSINDEFQSNIQEATSAPETEIDTKIVSQELSQEQEQNIVETTPSYNRVRVRPGVIRQYHQASSTESSRTDRRKSQQAITYRPAFDRRRTTMRIEEIEADLKTKQVHTRPEYHDYKQPIYKPEPSTDSPTPSSTTETPTKRGQFRRRRPVQVTSTEGSVTKRPYEIKNRFRGRRPTEKPTERPEIQTETSTANVKNNLHNHYSHRPRLSERYNKKPEKEDQISDDQDSNYSINRPKYAVPEHERWSPKISVDSFKPYNPNNIADEGKVASTNEKTKNQLDIITAKNEYEDILISVTPAYNNRVNKKIPDIPPTLEALVEQTKVTKSDSADTMSTFESMLEEVMKSLEEQDENEYTSKVMKHKGGEIGEIPPERIISSGENYSLKSTTPFQVETTTQLPDISSANVTEEVPNRKNRRRGFWKKVKVRPVTEGIDVAESQYYPNVVNRLGQYISKNSLEKTAKGNSKVAATTYKPNYQFLKDFFETNEEILHAIPNIDIPKIVTNKNESNTEVLRETSTTKTELVTITEKLNPGEMDLGTGSPDPTVDDSAYYNEPTEPVSGGADRLPAIDRSDGFSFMDYLFGVTSPDKSEFNKNDTTKSSKESKTTTELPKDNIDEVDTEAIKIKTTTESSYIPEEITDETIVDNIERVTEPVPKLHNKELRESVEKSVVRVESSSISSFMDPANVVSTSMSTEISHETEICFRGKCIKTNKNIL